MRRLQFFLLALLVTALALADPVQSVSQLSNSKAYTIHSQRGYWYVDDNGMLCTTSSSTVPETITDAYKFAVIKYNDGYYFYSLQAQGFLTRHDAKGYFDNDMGNAFRLEENASGDYKIIARMKYPAQNGGAGAMLTINDNNAGSIGLDSWSNADDGNRLYIEEFESFDATSALSLFTTDTKFSSHKVYTLAAVRGTWAASADGNSLSTTAVNTSATEEEQQFAVIKKDGAYYIYNVGTGKFLMKDGSLSDVKGDAMEYFVRHNTGAYAFFFIENSAFLNMQSNGSYTINGYYTPDDGNAVVPTEVNKDVYDAAMSVFYGSKTVTYNIIVNGKVVASEERENKVGDAASVSATYLNKEYVTYSYSPSTIGVDTETVEATVVFNGLPFELSDDFGNAHWYNIKIGANQRFVGWEDSEPYHTHAASGDSEQDATEIVRTRDAYQWAFMGNPVTGIKVVNKHTGASYSLTSEGTGTNVVGATGVPNTVLRNGNYYWDIHKNSDGFSLNLIGKTNYYINTHGAANGYFQIWESSYAQTDGGSRITVADVPDLETTITYNVSYNGDVVYTTTVPGIVGDVLGALPSGISRDFVTITGHDATASVTRDMTVALSATWDGPFELSADYEHAHWYDMAIRSNWYVTSDQTDSDGALSTVNANAMGLAENAYQWAFVGDPYHIKLYNKAKGSSNVFSASGVEANQGIPSFKSDDYTWKIVASISTAVPANSFCLNVDGTNLYINQYGGPGGSLKFWNSTSNVGDAGSAFTVFDVPTDFHEYAVAEIKPYVEPTGYFAFTDAVKASIGWKDSYETECPFEVYKSMKEKLLAVSWTDLNNFNLPPTGYYFLKSKMYGTYMGTDGSTLYGDRSTKSALEIVKLTKNDNTYSIAMMGKYAPASVAQSTTVHPADAEAFYTPVVTSLGNVAFKADVNAKMSCLHCRKEGDIVGWEAPADASIWLIENATGFNFTIGNAEYATLWLPFPVNIPQGMSAYTGTVNGEYLTLNELEGTIPAETAVVLKATAGSYTFTITDDAERVENALLGSKGNVEGGNGIYALAQKSGTVGFYPVGSVAIPVGKAYLVKAGASPVKGFYAFEEDDATGISDVESSTLNTERPVYNLAGQRISKMQRGINIINGKIILY